jgi:hypothetical protein
MLLPVKPLIRSKTMSKTMSFSMKKVEIEHILYIFMAAREVKIIKATTVLHRVMRVHSVARDGYVLHLSFGVRYREHPGAAFGHNSTGVCGTLLHCRPCWGNLKYTEWGHLCMWHSVFF